MTQRFVLLAAPAALLLVAGGDRLDGIPVPEFRDLFNGKDLAGWVNVNTGKDTWSVRKGELFCSGHPIGVMRTEKEYENFILHIENLGVIINPAINRINDRRISILLDSDSGSRRGRHPRRPLQALHEDLLHTSG